MSNGMIFFILCDLVMTFVITLGCGWYIYNKIKQSQRMSWVEIIILICILFFAWGAKITGCHW